MVQRSRGGKPVTMAWNGLRPLAALWVAAVLALPGAVAANPFWIQIEARPSRPQAEVRAQDWAADFPDLRGFQMRSGWYAMSLGPFVQARDAAAALRALRDVGRIPQDSYIVPEQSYGAGFWPPADAAAGQPTTEGAEEDVTPDTASADSETAKPATGIFGLVASGDLPSDPAASPEGDATGPAADPALPPLPLADMNGTEMDGAELDGTDRADPGAAASLPPEALESREEALRRESRLSRAERMEIQSALQWFGFYGAAVDGAFGKGTRTAIAAWQAAAGGRETGVLSAREQAQLLQSAEAERAVLGLETVEDRAAGLSIDLPTGLVAFAGHAPPFVEYRARDGSGVAVLLISRAGDAAALAGLYDRVAALPDFPADGPRKLERTGFTLSGVDAPSQPTARIGHAEARLSGGLIKGFVITYPAAQAGRMGPIVAAMRASFRPIGSTALDPALGAPLAVGREELMAGVAPAQTPAQIRSGVHLDRAGHVLTAAQGLSACTRLTIDDLPATLVFQDADLGLALLSAGSAAAPAAVAAFATQPPAKTGTRIAMAGFSYPETMAGPVSGFGTIAALSGHEDRSGRARLALRSRPGDAGGPVLDATGALIGLVLPPAEEGRALPPGLTEALLVTPIRDRLAKAGITPEQAAPSGSLAQEDLARRASALTARIACLNTR